MMTLFEKGYIGKLQIKNRIVMAPMNVGGNNESDGCLSTKGLDYFVERAKGGAGLIVTGAVRVTREFERDPNTIPLWMLFADHMIHTKWISQLAERCHDYGTKVAIQLTPGGGRQAGRYAQENNLAIGPSANPCYYPPYQPTRPLTKTEIHKMVLAFENSARLIKNAGADAIQLHGHEGYLLDQFTSPLWNRREDEYGGSLENRLRFSKELIDAIKRGAGKDFPIIYRFGLSHFIGGGRGIEEGIRMAQLLESYGVEALDIDAGCYENWYMPHPPTTIPCGSFAYLAHLVKEKVNIPVISSGRIGYPEIAEEILQKGQADFICLGRPLIADPYWGEKARKNETETIRPCLACHEGCLKRLMLYKSLSCAVNPSAGDEEYLKVTKSVEIKKVLVAGGGIAGMVAAITSAQRGHEVILVERDSSLGGNFRMEFIPKFKDDYKRYIQYLIHQIELHKITVLFNKEVSIELLSEYNPDVVFNAIGAHFNTLQIPGLENGMSLDPFKLYQDVDFSGVKVLIVGGGLIGVEAAINVASHGGSAVIIERENELAKLSYRANREHLLLLLEQYKVEYHLNTTIIEVDSNIAICKNNNEVSLRIDYDKISICVGMTPNQSEIQYDEKVIILGDADSPENVMNAVWTAYRKARLI